MVASPYTLTGFAVIFILPHDTASSGLAPESLPSNSCTGSRVITHGTQSISTGCTMRQAATMGIPELC